MEIEDVRVLQPGADKARDLSPRITGGAHRAAGAAGQRGRDAALKTLDSGEGGIGEAHAGGVRSRIRIDQGKLGVERETLDHRGRGGDDAHPAGVAQGGEGGGIGRGGRGGQRRAVTPPGIGDTGRWGPTRRRGTNQLARVKVGGSGPWGTPSIRPVSGLARTVPWPRKPKIARRIEEPVLDRQVKAAVLAFGRLLTKPLLIVQQIEPKGQTLGIITWLTCNCSRWEP